MALLIRVLPSAAYLILRKFPYNVRWLADQHVLSEYSCTVRISGLLASKSIGQIRPLANSSIKDIMTVSKA